IRLCCRLLHAQLTTVTRPYTLPHFFQARHVRLCRQASVVLSIVEPVASTVVQRRTPDQGTHKEIPVLRNVISSKCLVLETSQLVPELLTKQDRDDEGIPVDDFLQCGMSR